MADRVIKLENFCLVRRETGGDGTIILVFEERVAGKTVRVELRLDSWTAMSVSDEIRTGMKIVADRWARALAHIRRAE